MSSETPDDGAAVWVPVRTESATGGPPRLARFEVVSTDAGHHAVIVGGNGEPVFTTEVHPDIEGASHDVEVAIEAVAAIFTGDPGSGVRRVDRRTGTPT